MYIYCFVEDTTHRLFVELLVPDPNKYIEPKWGWSNIKKDINRYINIAHSSQVVLMIDKDRTQCIRNRISDLLDFESYSKITNLIILIPATTIESWILADRQIFAKHFEVPLNKLPQNPDTLENPKEYLIDTIRQYSSKKHREDIVPIGSEPYGRNYFNAMKFFIQKKWSKERAAKNSPSLRKCLEHIEKYIL